VSSCIVYDFGDGCDLEENPNFMDCLELLYTVSGVLKSIHEMDIILMDGWNWQGCLRQILPLIKCRNSLTLLIHLLVIQGSGSV